MLFVSQTVEWLLPMPIVLMVTLVSLAFLGWRRKRPLRGLLLLAAIWATVLSIPALANRWIIAIEGPAMDMGLRPVPVDPSTTIIALGSGAPSRLGGGARLDLAGWERVHAAVALWNRTGGLAHRHRRTR